jgi:hypothetical protein
MSQAVDVLIVGGGPTGLALANALGRYDVTVLLVEEDPGVAELPRSRDIGVQVRKLKPRGLTVTQIAQRLEHSVPTVCYHVTRSEPIPHGGRHRRPQARRLAHQRTVRPARLAGRPAPRPLQGHRRKDREGRPHGMQGALHIHDTVGIGALRDGDDVVEAVTAQDIEQRDADLFRGWQVLMGRPLLWMNSVALIGTLQMCGVEGCEPRAAEVARPEIRNHLLGFPDDDRFAAAWRLQRALIRATVRVLTFAPLNALVEDLEAVAQLGVSIAWVATHCTSRPNVNSASRRSGS